MTLQPQEIASIKTAFKNNFRGGKIYLFGSRTDDKQLGGDIDLYLHLNLELSNFIDQMIFRFSKLQDTMGDKLFSAILETLHSNTVYYKPNL